MRVAVEHSNNSQRHITAVTLVLTFIFIASTAAEKVSAESVPSGIATLEATQAAFRHIAQSILPTVVEVNVVENVNASTSGSFHFNGNPFQFFFGIPSPRGRSPNMHPWQQFQQFQQRGLGSGIMVRQDGNTVYVLTNNHVAGNASQISIRLPDASKNFRDAAPLFNSRDGICSRSALPCLAWHS